MKRMEKQIPTERGLIYVKAKASRDEAISLGFTYAFSSSRQSCDFYSKTLDDKGYYHSFLMVLG